MQVPIDTCKAAANSRSFDDRDGTPRFRHERKSGNSYANRVTARAVNLDLIEALISRMSSPFRSARRGRLYSIQRLEPAAPMQKA